MSRFTDVDPKAWYAQDLEEAVKYDLIKGYPDGTFKPDEKVSRAESAVLSYRAYMKGLMHGVRVVRATAPAVVAIVNGLSVGSGTHIGGGVILTNFHVVDGAQDNKVWVKWPGAEEVMGEIKVFDAHILYSKPEVDLAIIDVESTYDVTKFPKVKLVPEDTELERGEPVWVLGTPVSLIGSVSQGIISFAQRQVRYQISEDPIRVAVIPDAIQTDAAINPGNSGGLMTNWKGELIGVPSMKMVDLALEGLGFAIGPKTIWSVMREAKYYVDPKDYENMLTSFYGFGSGIQVEVV